MTTKYITFEAPRRDSNRQPKRSNASKGAYKVRIRDGKGHLFEKKFTVNVWGGKRKAFCAALEHRNRLMDRLCMPVTNRKFVLQLSIRNRTGVLGVCRLNFKYHNKQYSGYSAHCYLEENVVRKKVFWIHKLGEDGAFKKAVAFRQGRLIDIYGHGARVVDLRYNELPQGSEIIQKVRSILPAHLPIDLREEIQQELILAILQRSITLDALDTLIVKGFIRRVDKTYNNPYSHISLDHLVAEGCRLEDVLEG